MAAYTAIDNPELYFQTKLWTGDDSTSNAITFDGSENMQADLIWLKPRTKVDNHRWMDSVRGVTKMLPSNSSGAEETISAGLASFDSNGFTLNTTDSGYNSSSYTYVSWNWKAGTSFTNDASATGIGATDSAGSVNETAGFSVCTYTGVGGTSTTIKHGLSTAPTVMLIKNRSDADDWAVYHQGIGNTHRLYLNNTDASTSAIGTFRNTSPTSSIFTVGDHASVNISGENYVAYIFAEKQGYSKFGSYSGNGNADGTFVYCGFQPAWLLAKKSSGTADWFLIDNKRSTINPTNHQLEANSTAAEDASGRFDFLSNGFKCVSSSTGSNGSGTTYIYMAFAENPFVTSTGIPTTAR